MQSTLSIEYVTPQQAQEWLLANGTNRPHRIDHVHYLASEMREGRFTNTAEIHLFDDGSDKHVANGQHTMMAIVEYGKPVQVTVRRSSGTPDECKMVKTVGHDKGKGRTTYDSLVFYDVAGSCTIGKGYLNKIGSAIRFAMSNFNNRSGGATPRISDLYIVQAIPLWESEFMMLREATMPCSHEMHNSLTRSDALSLALLTFHYQPEKAKDFWGGVASGVNLEEGDPRLKTIQYMMQSKYGRTRNRLEKPHVTARKLIYTWNKYFNGEQMLRNIPTGSMNFDAPVLIYGTHYTGKQPMTMWPDKRPIDARH